MTKLKIAIADSGLTKVEISDKANISQTHLFYLENGYRNPSYEVMKRLCHILNKTAEELFF